jgi:hypothetical protein
MSLITYNTYASASIALSSTKLDDVIKPMCLSKAEAKEARVQAKEARVLAKEANVQARVQAKEAKLQARVLAKEAKLQARVQAKEAKLQASVLAKEAKLQASVLARVQSKEAKLQARVQSKEAKMQARLLARVQSKEAKLQVREAIKQVRVAEREALRKRKERVKQIMRQYRIQSRRTENILIIQRYEETRRLASEERARLLLEERYMRRERRENGMDSSWVRQADGRWVIHQNPVQVIQERPQERPPRTNPVRSYANQRGPVRHQRVSVRRMTAVNPVQELINKDQIECNKTHAELIKKETAVDVTDCPICFDKLGNTNQMILRCGHTFCGDCIMEHMPRVGGLKCPVCRAQYGVRINGWIPPKPVK